MSHPWGHRPTRLRHRMSPSTLVTWRGANPLLCRGVPHAGHGGQDVGPRARSASTASTTWTERTRATCHAARISAVSERASSTARRRRCTDGSSSRMLSLRHSIGKRPPLEPLARNSKSVPDFRCYASPPPTEICARCQPGRVNLSVRPSPFSSSPYHFSQFLLSSSSCSPRLFLHRFLPAKP